MAAGDEKIDIFDQVRIKNRVTDAPVEVMFEGKMYVWKPGEVRSIPRAYANHFIHKSTFQWDPTEQNPPKRTLVLIDEKGENADSRPDIDVSDITMEQAHVLDLLDEEHLPPDRYTAIDDNGNSVIRGRKVGLNAGNDPRHFRTGGIARRVNAANPDMKAEVEAALKSIPEPAA